MNRNDSEKYSISPKEFREMNSETKIMHMAEGFEIPPGMDEKNALDILLTKIEDEKPAKVYRIKRFLQAAAAFIIITLAFYTFSTVLQNEKITTKFAEQTEFLLPDGTNVILNSDSKITWKKKKFKNSRNLKLTGEAYFEVKKGDEFIIETKNGNIEILGTQLNVFSRENEFWVSCISGKVKVTSNSEEQILEPGDLAELTSGRLLKFSKNDIKKTISWQEGVFYFEDKPLVSIFDELERQFDVSVQFNSNKQREITVAFSNKNLQEALDVICIPMELNYEIQENKKIIIFEKRN